MITSCPYCGVGFDERGWPRCYCLDGGSAFGAGLLIALVLGLACWALIALGIYQWWLSS